MNIKDELEALKEDNPSIVDDSFKFISKLSIGDEAYPIQVKTKKYFNLIITTFVGLVISFIAYALWYISLGLLGLFLLKLGLKSGPVGWLVLAGVVGSTATYGIVKAYNTMNKKIQNMLYHKVPKYTKAPIDILGKSIMSLVLPIAIRMVKSDLNFSERKNDVICKYFVDEWGFNIGFVENAIKEQEQLIENFNYNQYIDVLKDETRKHKEIKFDILVKEILFIQKEVMNADGLPKPEELEEMARLKEILKKC